MSYLDETGLGVVWNKIKNLIEDKQDKLISGTNIKTINGYSLLGSGNITISGGGGSGGYAVDYIYGSPTTSYQETIGNFNTNATSAKTTNITLSAQVNDGDLLNINFHCAGSAYNYHNITILLPVKRRLSSTLSCMGSASFSLQTTMGNIGACEIVCTINTPNVLTIYFKSNDTSSFNGAPASVQNIAIASVRRIQGILLP